MSDQQNNVNRFAGPEMIKDRDHLSGIPQAGSDNQQGSQSEQSQRGNRQQGATKRQRDEFEYHNPRQYS
jgi:hypothetical protein